MNPRPTGRWTVALEQVSQQWPLPSFPPTHPSPSPPGGGHSPGAPARSSAGKRSLRLRKNGGREPEQQKTVAEYRKSGLQPLRRFAPASWSVRFLPGPRAYLLKRPARFLLHRSAFPALRNNPPWKRVLGTPQIWSPTSSGPRRPGWWQSRFPRPEPCCRLRTGR